MCPNAKVGEELREFDLRDSVISGNVNTFCKDAGQLAPGFVKVATLSSVLHPAVI